MATPVGVGRLLALHWQMSRVFGDVLARIDVREKDGVLSIAAELPQDVGPQELGLQLNWNLLTIFGETKRGGGCGGADESYCRFRRTVQLPFSPRPEEVRSSLQERVITIQMPI
jgi:HSP20 family molecular chaperone IbpA